MNICHRLYKISANSTIVVFCCCIMIISASAQDMITGATGKAKVKKTANSAKKWLSAVAKAKVAPALKVATLSAGKIQKTTSEKNIYLKIASKENISSTFFSEPFNKFDFKLWYDAFFLKKKLMEFGVFALKDKEMQLKKIFDKVVSRIKTTGKPTGLIPWPTGVWVRKYGASGYVVVDVDKFFLYFFLFLFLFVIFLFFFFFQAEDGIRDISV